MFGFQEAFGGIGPFSNQFKTQYRCYSVSMLAGADRQDVDRGGKIIMPSSALDQLTRLNIVYPMLFKLTNKKADRMSHSGVLEFVADEGKVYLPYWMMQNLLLQEGDLLTVESTSLQVASYSKFEPQSVEFLDISNPKAVLENILRGFACLTKNDMIAIKYNERIYELRVLETKPTDAVCIIECDMNVEFAPPVGYVEPERPRPKEQEPENMQVDESEYIDTSKFMYFQGAGNRLDGKQKKDSDDKPVPTQVEVHKRGIPNYDYKKGSITFIRSSRPMVSNGNALDTAAFEAFSGSGQMLRPKNKKK